MARRCFFLVVLLSALSGTGGAVAQEAEAKKAAPEPLPPVWQDLIAEVRAIVAADPKDKEYPDRSKLVGSSAQKLADKYGRKGIIALYQHRSTPVHALTTDAESRVVHDLYHATIARIADPKNTLGIQDAVNRSVRYYHDLSNLVPVAIDLYHDNEAREFLIRETILDPGPVEERLGTNDRPNFDWEVGMQLLRSYDMEDVRAKIENTRNKWLTASKDPEKKDSYRRASSELSQLNALLASMDYAKSLPDDATRERYRQFESRLWRAWALAGGKQSRKAWVGHTKAAHALTHRIQHKLVNDHLKPEYTVDWDRADEPFVLRILSDVQTTENEEIIVSFMKIPISEESKAKLRVAAEGDSNKARYAKSLLDASESVQDM
ncbi:MAG: hypothetical protein SGJ20_13715 [Planctomycetota bacterium]|nr:hypothetical protein [Planctomycetota bacterium]